MYIHTSIIALPLPIATGGVICWQNATLVALSVYDSFRKTGTTTARAALCTLHFARMSLYISTLYTRYAYSTCRTYVQWHGNGDTVCPIATRIHDDLTLAWRRGRCRCSNTQRKGHRTYVLVGWRDSHLSHIGGKSGRLQLLPFTLQKSVAPSHDGSWYGAPLAQMTPYKVWCARCPVHEYWYVCMYPLVRV